MPLISRLASLRRNLFSRPEVERDLDEELRACLELLTEEKIAEGLDPAAARRAAAIELGGVEQVKEKVREAKMGHYLETLWQDLRYAWRVLRRNPVANGVAVLSLALGIGANTALFSTMDALLLRMLPVKDPDRLVLFKSLATNEFSPGSYSGTGNTDPATGNRVMTSFPYQSYLRLREQPGALSDVMAFGQVGLNANARGQAETADGQAVSGNYYQVLGVEAAIGRTLADADDRAGAAPVAVLSHRYWLRRFNGDEGVVGEQINLNNVAFTVVGVTPQGFDGTMQVGSSQDVTIPIACEPQLYVERERSRMHGAGVWWLRLMGRLKDGATPEQARAQSEIVFQTSVIEHRAARQQLRAQTQGRGGAPILPLEPKDYPRLRLDPGGQGEMNAREYYAQPLYLLLGVVALVLLIACANVANLLLARATARRKEIGVRLALGANRARLIRQLLTESATLSVLGGAIGLLFAVWIKDGLLAVGDWGGPGMNSLEPRLNLRVLGFTLGLSLLTGIVFGLVPAWRATKIDLTPALKDAGRNSSAASHSVLSQSLIVAQVALSLLLLVGAGLFLRSLLNLQKVELGFDPHNLLLFSVDPGLIGYKDERLLDFYQRAGERLEAIPDVRAVTLSRTTLIAHSSDSRSVYLRQALSAAPYADGRLRPSGDSHVHLVRENFLEVMNIPLLFGRVFAAQDDARAPKVAIVNQTFAKKYFNGENPIGQRFTFDEAKPDEVEIVGLSRDAKYARQRDEIPPTIYLPWRQEPKSMTRATFEVRTAGDPLGVVPAVREAVREVDANLPLDNVKTQTAQAEDALRAERLFTRLLGLFGLLAQQLAAIGLYGVMAYGVARRANEIGIRMALGASRWRILRMILRQGLGLTLLGIALGAAGSYALIQYLESQMKLSGRLYGVTLADPATYLATAALLMMVALVACYVPARRATKIDPMIALRHE